ncbi:MAG: hypothetical protein KF724_02650 [Phycisphaeraceae bacterium]|nr:hypothetical protein [Phycisphaeraceae bacterium]
MRVVPPTWLTAMASGAVVALGHGFVGQIEGAATLTPEPMGARAVSADQAHAPLAPHRVATFTFEPDPALPRELPAGLYRLLSRDSAREGLPPFGGVGSTEVIGAQGGWALRFALAGGAMAVATEPAIIPVLADEVIEASVLVQTQGVERSCVRLVIRALDASLEPIPDAQWEASGRAIQGWQRLLIRSGPAPAGSRSMEVAMEVTPCLPDDPTGDVAGSVIFDNLEIWRVPRVTIGLDRAGARPGPSPRAVTVQVNDPLGAAMTRGVLRDADGRVRVEWSATGEAHYEVEVPPLGLGAFEVEVEALSGTRSLDRVRMPFAIIEPDERSESRRVPIGGSEQRALVRMGLWLDRERLLDRADAVHACSVIGPDFVVIDVGDGRLAPSIGLSLAETRLLVDDLMLAGVEPILRISRVPASLAPLWHLEQDDPAGVFLREDDAWREVYGAWFERFGHLVSRWMVAGSDAGRSTIVTTLDGLVPGFEEISSTLRVVDTTGDGARTTADLTALELIRHWQEGASMIAVRGALDPEPAAAALALRGLTSAARGVRSVATLDAGSDLECLLLSSDEAARVLAWRRDGGAARALSLPFDGGVLAARDALGVPMPLERRQGAVEAVIGSTPVIIDGVDPLLGAFLSKLRFEPAALEGSTAEQRLAVRLVNPWDVTMEGTLRFVAPVDWSFIPRMRRFSLPPGASGEVIVSVTLPRTQPSGATRVGIELEFTADRGHALRVDPPVAIEVRDFTCEALLRPITLADGRPGAVVDLVLVNRSDRPLELESILSTTSGTARRDGPIRLEPGARAKRSVRLDEPISGAILLSVNQTNGPLRLVRVLR